MSHSYLNITDYKEIQMKITHVDIISKKRRKKGLMYARGI